MKYFNVTGTCIPSDHYMVDLTPKLEKVKKLVDKRLYFSINRGRQHGKTTMISELRKFLANDYTIISISFEGMGDKEFSNREVFIQSFLNLIHNALQFTKETQEYRDSWLNEYIKDFLQLSGHIADLCANKKVVLIIDEVDRGKETSVLLNFLSMLRAKFLDRSIGKGFTFHSVILASVSDVKTSKLAIKTLHAPWNIAAKFNVDLAFSAKEIDAMLLDYEKDHDTGMNIAEIAEEIHFHTNGYPVLVSMICKHIDEELDKDFSLDNVREATQMIVSEKHCFFATLLENLEECQELYDLLYDVLINEFTRNFSHGVPVIDLGYSHGFIIMSRGVKVSNRIFELWLKNYFRQKKNPSAGWIKENGKDIFEVIV